MKGASVHGRRPRRLSAEQRRLKLFVSERHRHDVSDIVHQILCVGDVMD